MEAEETGGNGRGGRGESKRQGHGHQGRDDDDDDDEDGGMGYGEKNLFEKHPKAGKAAPPAVPVVDVDAERHRQKGNEYYAKKRYVEAVACYTKAIARDPTSPVYVNLYNSVNPSYYIRCIHPLSIL
jgi:tetratricopeptide (TPR) repeat protein